MSQSGRPGGIEHSSSSASLAEEVGEILETIEGGLGRFDDDQRKAWVIACSGKDVAILHEAAAILIGSMTGDRYVRPGDLGAAYREACERRVERARDRAGGEAPLLLEEQAAPPEVAARHLAEIRRKLRGMRADECEEIPR